VLVSFFDQQPPSRLSHWSSRFKNRRCVCVCPVYQNPMRWNREPLKHLFAAAQHAMRTAKLTMSDIWVGACVGWLKKETRKKFGGMSWLTFLCFFCFFTQHLAVSFGRWLMTGLLFSCGWSVYSLMTSRFIFSPRVSTSWERKRIKNERTKMNEKQGKKKGLRRNSEPWRK
jgi:hypothetical protein